MSQAGIVDITGSHPDIPTLFVANVGTAVPIANTIELLGASVASHGVPLQTVASGNTVNFNIQYASADSSSVDGNAGVASFNSLDFSVDSNGFVTLLGSIAAEEFDVDTSSPPGTNPVVPNGSGIITVTGGQVAAGTTSNVIQTNSLAANSYTIQIQRSQAVASSTVGDNGVSHFNSSQFGVDSNGFVTLLGGTTGAVLGNTVDAHTSPGTNPVVPNASGLIVVTGGQVAAGTTANVIQTDSLAANTYTVQIQRSQAVASSTVGDNGVSHFNSSQFLVDANGFVSLNGASVGETITGNTGGALSPTSGNWNILGTGSTTTSGLGSTLTIELTGLSNHSVLVGAGSPTITNVAPSSTAGIPFVSNGSSSDPSFTTATVPGGGTGDTSFTAYAPVCGGTTTTGALQSASTGMSNVGYVWTSNGSSSLPSFQAVSASAAFTSINIQTFTSSGTYTPTSGMKYCTIEIVGGGGGSGGTDANNGSSLAAAPGGGGGGYSRKTVSASTIGASQTVTVGLGGAAGSNSPGNGGTGGTTSVGTIVSATGGQGSVAGGTVTSGSGGVVYTGGLGGIGSSGDVNIQGQGGGTVWNNGSNYFGGNGGSSYFGGGPPSTNNGAGATATGYGSGASGGSYGPGSSAEGGTAGAPGFVIITEYI